MGYNGKCIHGQLIFDKKGNLTRCLQCYRNAMLGLNQVLLNKFMTEAEQKQYGLKSE